jgi:uncharacterized membrane protein HdeD (DUF308 family)
MALRGLLAAVFGVITLRSPGVTATALLMFFALYAFADAVLDFFLAVRLARRREPWGWYLFEGLVSAAAGVAAIVYPAVTLIVAVAVIAIRALVLGVLELFAAFSWTHESRWLFGSAGAASVVFGALLLGNPAAGAVALLWMVALYAIIFGLLLFAVGLRIVWSDRQVPRMHGPAHSASV